MRKQRTQQLVPTATGQDRQAAENSKLCESKGRKTMGLKRSKLFIVS